MSAHERAVYIVCLLRRTAHEIAEAGEPGWGNACTMAADFIEQEVTRAPHDKEGEQ